MKKLTIWTREITVRTPYRCYRFRKCVEYFVKYGDMVFRNGHWVDKDNPHLRVPFYLLFETRSRKELDHFIHNLGRTQHEKWLKETLNAVYIGGLER